MNEKSTGSVGMISGKPPIITWATKLHLCEQLFHYVDDRHPELAVADLPVLVPVHRLNHVLDLARCQLVNQDNNENVYV